MKKRSDEEILDSFVDVATKLLFWLKAKGLEVPKDLNASFEKNIFEAKDRTEDF
jgi:molecular chaperone GrpE (heat shock protein)